ncbi:CrpP family ICE-associated protein, partial [Pseudomonas aeruginosa]
PVLSDSVAHEPVTQNFGHPLRVFDCPYSHPAMRASWLKGFAQEQQQQLDF